MNEVKIVGKPISVKEWHGQRVVTFKDIDTVHGRVDGTARRNFNKNKNHFIEGEDWYKIQPNEIRTVGISSPNGGIVLTETGYLMLAKSFTDDLAWKVQRQLVNSYFRFKETKVKDKQLEFYNYFDKTYKGEPVLSIADVEYFTGLNRYSISKALKTGVEFMDYYYIDGENLMRFKNDNPKLSKLVSEMYIVTKSGFEMICKAYGIEIETPKLFIEDKKVFPVKKNSGYEQVDVDDYITTLRVLRAVRKNSLNILEKDRIDAFDSCIHYVCMNATVSTIK